MLSLGDKTGENVPAMAVGAYHFPPGKMHDSAGGEGEVAPAPLIA
jgi:hypothetical protein